MTRYKTKMAVSVIKWHLFAAVAMVLWSMEGEACSGKGGKESTTEAVDGNEGDAKDRTNEDAASPPSTKPKSKGTSKTTIAVPSDRNDDTTTATPTATSGATTTGDNTTTTTIGQCEDVLCACGTNWEQCEKACEDEKTESDDLSPCNCIKNPTGYKCYMYCNHNNFTDDNNKIVCGNSTLNEKCFTNFSCACSSQPAGVYSACSALCEDEKYKNEPVCKNCMPVTEKIGTCKEFCANETNSGRYQSVCDELCIHNTTCVCAKYPVKDCARVCKENDNNDAVCTECFPNGPETGEDWTPSEACDAFCNKTGGHEFPMLCEKGMDDLGCTSPENCCNPAGSYRACKEACEKDKFQSDICAHCKDGCSSEKSANDDCIHWCKDNKDSYPHACLPCVRVNCDFKDVKCNCKHKTISDCEMACIASNKSNDLCVACGNERERPTETCTQFCDIDENKEFYPVICDYTDRDCDTIPGCGCKKNPESCDKACKKTDQNDPPQICKCASNYNLYNCTTTCRTETKYNKTIHDMFPATCNDRSVNSDGCNTPQQKDDKKCACKFSINRCREACENGNKTGICACGLDKFSQECTNFCSKNTSHKKESYIALCPEKQEKCLKEDPDPDCKCKLGYTECQEVCNKRKKGSFVSHPCDIVGKETSAETKESLCHNEKYEKDYWDLCNHEVYNISDKKCIPNDVECNCKISLTACGLACRLLKLNKEWIYKPEVCKCVDDNGCQLCKEQNNSQEYHDLCKKRSTNCEDRSHSIENPACNCAISSKICNDYCKHSGSDAPVCACTNLPADAKNCTKFCNKDDNFHQFNDICKEADCTLRNSTTPKKAIVDPLCACMMSVDDCGKACQGKKDLICQCKGGADPKKEKRCGSICGSVKNTSKTYYDFCHDFDCQTKDYENLPECACLNVTATKVSEKCKTACSKDKANGICACMYITEKNHGDICRNFCLNGNNRIKHFLTCQDVVQSIQIKVLASTQFKGNTKSHLQNCTVTLKSPGTGIVLTDSNGEAILPLRFQPDEEINIEIKDKEKKAYPSTYNYKVKKNEQIQYLQLTLVKIKERMQYIPDNSSWSIIVSKNGWRKSKNEETITQAKTEISVYEYDQKGNPTGKYFLDKDHPAGSLKDKIINGIRIINEPIGGGQMDFKYISPTILAFTNNNDNIYLIYIHDGTCDSSSDRKEDYCQMQPYRLNTDGIMIQIQDYNGNISKHSIGIIPRFDQSLNQSSFYVIGCVNGRTGPMAENGFIPEPRDYGDIGGEYLKDEVIGLCNTTRLQKGLLKAPKIVSTRRRNFHDRTSMDSTRNTETINYS